MTNTANADLFDVLKVRRLTGSLPAVVTGIACDSRQVRPGYVFVAVQGTNRNGMDYVADALNRGAVAVVGENLSGGLGICTVAVEDARLALALLSVGFYKDPSSKMFVAGITGTNGKTTTAFIIRDILTRAGRKVGMTGTVEYSIGDRTIPASRTTPEAPALQQYLHQMLSVDCNCAVMEVSSHALDQKRTAGIHFDVGILTNLTRDHLDYHKTRENYANAKKILFEGLEQGAAAVLNIDDDLGQGLAVPGSLACETLTYGTAERADFRILSIVPGGNGTAFTLLRDGARHELETNMVGRHNIYNIVAALAAAERAGVRFEQAAAALTSLPVIPGRLQEVPNRRGIKIFVDYAHTDDALEKILSSLREITEKRLILVFGCGGDRDRSKRPAMGAVAERLADFSIITSDNPRKENPDSIIAGIEKGFTNTSVYAIEPDRKKAILKALEAAESGDVVIVAGKGHENFQELEHTTVAFDDRKTVSILLDEMGG